MRQLKLIGLLILAASMALPTTALASEPSFKITGDFFLRVVHDRHEFVLKQCVGHYDDDKYVDQSAACRILGSVNREIVARMRAEIAHRHTGTRLSYSFWHSRLRILAAI